MLQRKEDTLFLKESSDIFVKCTEMNWETSDVNGLCISIQQDNMGLFLCVIGKNCNGGCLIYIFTENVENGNPIIFNKTLY